jgi:ubiquinone/menaquinone biosynthesis C-methylase UbiE
VNRLHKWYCRREKWKRHVREDLVPTAIEEVELGDDVLEVGPGFGPATEVLRGRADRVTALELDPALAADLRRRIGPGTTVVEGDATDLPFADGSFSGATCFTMLHHIPSADMQDRMFAEVHRVLEPGGSFAGTDSFAGGLAFKLAHLGDVNTPIDPDTLGERLERAGFGEVEVDVGPGVAAQTVFFRARTNLRGGFEGRPG